MSQDKKKTKSTEIQETYTKAVSALADARNAHNAAAKALKRAGQALAEKVASERADGDRD